MSPHSEPAAVAAVPTIQRVLHDFLEDRRRALSPVEFRLYQHVIFFLEYCVNNQGYRNLGEDDRARYERLYHESGGATQFFQVFGPKLLLPELDDFGDVFIREGVHTSERVMKKSKDVVSDLRDWLVESGILPPSVVDHHQEREDERRRLRWRLKRLVRLVARHLVTVDPMALAPEDHVAQDYHLVSRIEAGRIWLRVYRSAVAEEIGPLSLPRGAAECLRVGWSFRCALGRLRGRWQLVELEEIHPRE